MIELKKVSKRTIAKVVLTVVEIILIISLLTISLLAMLTLETNTDPQTGFMQFINFFQQYDNRYWCFFIIVFPLIALFLFNAFLLFKVIYSGRIDGKSAISEQERLSLIEEAKRQVREELVKEMKAEKEAKKTNKK